MKYLMLVSFFALGSNAFAADKCAKVAEAAAAALMEIGSFAWEADTHGVPESISLHIIGEKEIKVASQKETAKQAGGEQADYTSIVYKVRSFNFNGNELSNIDVTVRAYPQGSREFCSVLSIIDNKK